MRTLLQTLDLRGLQRAVLSVETSPRVAVLLPEIWSLDLGGLITRIFKQPLSTLACGILLLLVTLLSGCAEIPDVAQSRHSEPAGEIHGRAQWDRPLSPTKTI